jgi:hypothetical protein
MNIDLHSILFFQRISIIQNRLRSTQILDPIEHKSMDYKP